jgi:hypothetical protein
MHALETEMFFALRVGNSDPLTHHSEDGSCYGRGSECPICFFSLSSDWQLSIAGLFGTLLGEGL